MCYCTLTIDMIKAIFFFSLGVFAKFIFDKQSINFDNKNDKDKDIDNIEKTTTEKSKKNDCLNTEVGQFYIQE